MKDDEEKAWLDSKRPPPAPTSTEPGAKDKEENKRALEKWNSASDKAEELHRTDLEKNGLFKAEPISLLAKMKEEKANLDQRDSDALHEVRQASKLVSKVRAENWKFIDTRF